MNQIMAEIHNTLDIGIMSPKFDFTPENVEKQKSKKIDMDKLQYNASYKTYEYQKSRIPAGLYYLPGIDEIIQNNMDNSTTPMEEYERKFNSSSRL
jgi:hypothetical protein